MISRKLFVLTFNNGDNAFSVWNLVSLILPLLTGIIVAMLSVYLQRRMDEKKYKQQKIAELRMQLMDAYIILQNDVLGYITRIMNIQKYLPIIIANDMAVNHFCRINLETEKTYFVLNELKQILLSHSIEQKKATSNDFQYRTYCELIESYSSFVLNPDVIPESLRKFGMNGAQAARVIGGDDLHDFDTVNNDAVKMCHSNFIANTIWDLQKEIVDKTIRCEERIKTNGKR